MKRALTIPLLLLGAFTLGDAAAGIRTVTDPAAPRSLPEQGPVSVRWEDPANFSEIRYSHNQFESRRGNWVEELAEHLRESTEPRLAPGERLEINITDIRRAGATTIAELTAAGVPAILVPLPTAADDHQRKNAEVLVKAGAADLIEQKLLTGALLAERIEALLADGERRSTMSAAARGVARPDAAAAIVDRALALVDVT